MAQHATLNGTTTPADQRVSIRIDNLPAPKKGKYRAIELKNGVRACLISRKVVPNSNASSEVVISLGVGRLQDPKNCRGLAELCHELTVSKDSSCNWSRPATAVYEDIIEYRKELNSRHLPDFLKSLANNLLNPRFTEADIENIVKKDDYCQGMISLKWLQQVSGNPAHPLNRLAQGTTEKTIFSYTASELRGYLEDFHKRYYSCNLLRLAIEDGRSPDELEALVAETFVDFPNRSAPDQNVIRADQLHGVTMHPVGVKIRGNVYIDKMVLAFSVPDQTGYRKTSPDLYVKEFLEKDYAGSLVSCLDSHGLILKSVELMDSGQAGCDLFSISVGAERSDKLTPELENTAIKIIFRFLEMLRSKGPQQWFFNEIKIGLQSQYESKTDSDHMGPSQSSLELVHDNFMVASRLQRFPIQDALSARHLLTEYSPKIIENFLNFLTPNQCTVFSRALDSKSINMSSYYVPPVDELASQKNAQNYSFTVENLSPELLKACSVKWPQSGCKLDNGFKMPQPKPFMPVDVSLRPRVVEQQPPGPRQLDFPSRNVRLWFRQDDKFQSELAFVSVNLIAPIESSSATQSQLDILVHLFVSALKKLKQQVSKAYLDLNVSRSCSGIQICCSGFTEPLAKLMEVALKCIAETSINKENFEKARRAVLNTVEEPIQSEEKTEQLANRLNLAGFIGPMKLRQTEATIKGVTLSDIQSIASHFCNPTRAPSPKSSEKITTPQRRGSELLPQGNLSAEILVYGNATVEDALKAAQDIVSAMPSLSSTAKVALNRENIGRRELFLPRGSHSVLQRVGNEIKSSTGRASICSLVFQITNGEPVPGTEIGNLKIAIGEEFKVKTCHSCLLQLILEAANDVEVPHPLSKIVKQIKRGFSANCFIFETVIDTSPSKMEKNTESFIAILGDRLSALSSDALAVYKQRSLSALKDLLSPRSVEDQHSVYWNCITSGSVEFANDDPRAMDCAQTILNAIKKEDIEKYWQKWFRYGSPDRTVLCLQVFDGMEIEKPQNSSVTVITDVEAFKATLKSK